MNQFFIFTLSMAAIFCSQNSSEKIRKYACLFGIASQPFWLYETWYTNQTGMFLLAIVYTFIWLMGFYNFWIKREKRL